MADLHPDIVGWGFASDPADPGWLFRPAGARGHFADLFGELRIRIDGPRIARLRIAADPRLRNTHGGMHGGAILAAIDQAVFMCGAALGIARVSGGATIDISTQFIGRLEVGRPFDVIVEFLRETGRMAFLRGTVEQQGDAIAAAFAVTIRRASA